MPFEHGLTRIDARKSRVLTMKRAPIGVVDFYLVCCTNHRFCELMADS